jgi:8-oxo-dGTP diphosphatase
MTEEEFLENYRQRDYPRPSVTVDLLIFTILDTDLKVLLIKRGGHPCRGKWALPGGFVDVGDGTKEDQGESVEKGAARELGEECFGDQEGSSRIIDRLLADHRVHLEQLYTFGEPYRDPRCRVITVAHYALVPPDLIPLVKASSDAREAKFFSVTHEVDPDELAFDHAEILRVGIERIRGKIDYAPIAFSLLPETFTVSELRAVHEAIKGTTYDKANFRRRFRRMMTDGILTEAPGKRASGQSGGPAAKVFRFVRAPRDPYAYTIG